MSTTIPLSVFASYGLPAPKSILSLDDGLINDSFVLIDGEKKLFLQALNPHVFKDPKALMENITLLSEHFKKKEIPSLRLIKTTKDQAYAEEEGRIYRLFEYSEAPNASEVGARNRVIPVAEAFGRLHVDLMDFPSEKLKPSIEGFHNLEHYLKEFDEAIKLDSQSRLIFLGGTLDDFLDLRHEMLKRFREAWTLPLRAIHADAKASNVLLSHPPLIVDYDTFMQAPLAYDHGDLIRTLCTFSAEDEVEIDTVKIEADLLGIFVKHYLMVAGDFLSVREKDFIVPAGELVLYELGIRFLTDYLNGDTYFKTTDSEQNLRRGRVQMALLRSLKSVGK